MIYKKVTGDSGVEDGDSMTVGSTLIWGRWAEDGSHINLRLLTYKGMKKAVEGITLMFYYSGASMIEVHLGMMRGRGSCMDLRRLSCTRKIRHL